MRCPICAAPAAFAFYSKHVEVLKCSAQGCGHLFAQERPSGTGVMTIEDLSFDFSEYGERNGRLVKRLCKDGVLFAGANVLDFGSGLGHVALALRDLAGANVFCAEGDPESAKRL